MRVDFTKPVIRIEPECKRLNDAITAKYHLHSNDPQINKSHYFSGRFENIYIPIEQIPETRVILDKLIAIIKSEGICSCEDPSIGFWFNEMKTGDITSLHNHDDFDEKVSAVYYVAVPRDSGKLVIHLDNEIVKVTPEAGMFVLFNPVYEHEVLVNNSNSSRLSIGINVGLG